MSDMTHPDPANLKSGPKTCARCGASFVCKVDDLPHCQCVGVSLSPETLGKLQEAYSDCLCSRCLKELAGKERDGDVLINEGQR
ncbi:MAG: cysteine-rich CWC family protein [Thiohalocapsa sp.]|jgi:hypothetical protein|uniref:cysteine-rich CWC family protein n=1 Tax=Thiohalocapsa sp. TaxID=2497641 RepID=UPI0025F19059|nr:cysteine-rich CWC family protein [Thiohalocapsa sp.]